MINKMLAVSILSAGYLLNPVASFAVSPVVLQSQIKDEMTPEKLKKNMMECAQRLKHMADATPKAKKKQTALKLYFSSVQAAHHLKKNKNALLIDVRTPEETMFLGMPTAAAANIPFMYVDTTKYSAKKKRYKMKKNIDFVKQADKFIKSQKRDEFSTIILMCRSGSRSAKAVNALAAAGYDTIYTVVDGFEGDKDKKGQRTVNGWKNNKLPWSYKIASPKSFNAAALPMSKKSETH